MSDCKRCKFNGDRLCAVNPDQWWIDRTMAMASNPEMRSVLERYLPQECSDFEEGAEASGEGLRGSFLQGVDPCGSRYTEITRARSLIAGMGDGYSVPEVQISSPRVQIRFIQTSWSESSPISIESQHVRYVLPPIAERITISAEDVAILLRAQGTIERTENDS